MNIYHRGCTSDQPIGKWTGSKYSRRARHFVRLDGSSPDPDTPFNEKCPHCEGSITGLNGFLFKEEPIEMWE